MASPAIKYTCGDAGMTTPASKFARRGPRDSTPASKFARGDAGMRGAGIAAGGSKAEGCVVT